MGNMQGVGEGIVLMVLFVVLLGAVVSHFNNIYDTNHTIGLDTSSLDDFTSQVQTANEQISGGEATQVNDGLSLTTSWALAKGFFGVAWNFINGSWIPQIIIGMLHFTGTAGVIIATVLRMLFLITLIWAVIKLFFKVKF